MSWTKTPSDPSSSEGANTAESQYDLGGLPPGEYSVSIQAVCNENSSVVSEIGSRQIIIPSGFTLCVYICTYSGNSLIMKSLTV